MEKEIKNNLLHSFEVHHLEIQNDSKLHSRPGNHTHYRVLLVSNDFENLGKVKRHQAVYKSMDNFFQKGLHSLSLQTYTIEEWKEQQMNNPSRCKGSNQ